MIKKGIVIKTEGHRACIMTEDGQFVKVKINKDIPEIGEIYSGKQVSGFTYLKYAQLAASVVIAMFLICFYRIYYTPAATVVVSINPSIRLETNRWDRIIKIEPLNKDGGTLIKEVNIKNKTLDDGLKIIIKQAVDDKYLTDEYSNKIQKSVVTNGTGTKKIKIYIDKGNKNVGKNVSKNVESNKKYADGNKINDVNKLNSENKLNDEVKSVKFGTDVLNQIAMDLSTKKTFQLESMTNQVLKNKKNIYNGLVEKYSNTIYRSSDDNDLVNKLLQKDDKNINKFNKISVHTSNRNKINVQQKKTSTFSRNKINVQQKKTSTTNRNKINVQQKKTSTINRNKINVQQKKTSTFNRNKINVQQKKTSTFSRNKINVQPKVNVQQRKNKCAAKKR